MWPLSNPFKLNFSSFTFPSTLFDCCLKTKPLQRREPRLSDKRIHECFSVLSVLEVICSIFFLTILCSTISFENFMLHAVSLCGYFELETSGEEIICAQSENIIAIEPYLLKDELKLTKNKRWSFNETRPYIYLWLNEFRKEFIIV